MPSNWDRFDLSPEAPFFTLEERARITKVHNELRAKYDPVLEAEMKRGPVNITRSGSRAARRKVRSFERAEGL